MTAAARVRLRIVPGAGASAVLGRQGDAWKVRVGAPAERGAVNTALLRLLADAPGLGRRDVTLVSGHGAREKIVELAGLAPAEVERRLASAEREGLCR